MTRYTPNDLRADERIWAAAEAVLVAEAMLRDTMRRSGALSQEANDAQVVLLKARKRARMLEAAERRRKVR